MNERTSEAWDARGHAGPRHFVLARGPEPRAPTIIFTHPYPLLLLPASHLMICWSRFVHSRIHSNCSAPDTVQMFGMGRCAKQTQLPVPSWLLPRFLREKNNQQDKVVKRILCWPAVSNGEQEARLNGNKPPLERQFVVVVVVIVTYKRLS